MCAHTVDDSPGFERRSHVPRVTEYHNELVESSASLLPLLYRWHIIREVLESSSPEVPKALAIGACGHLRIAQGAGDDRPRGFCHAPS